MSEPLPPAAPRPARPSPEQQGRASGGGDAEVDEADGGSDWEWTEVKKRDAKAAAAPPAGDPGAAQGGKERREETLVRAQRQSTI